MKVCVTEVFKDIPGWEVYEISNLGRVRRKKSGRILKQSVTRTKYTKYRMVHLSMNNVPRKFLVHRLVLLAFVGPCPDGMECLHNDDDPFNNCVDNLSWGTSKQNKERWDRKGSKHSSSRITEADVIEMRQSSETHNEVAARLGISSSHVCQIRLGQTAWTHVPMPCLDD